MAPGKIYHKYFTAKDYTYRYFLKRCQEATTPDDANKDFPNLFEVGPTASQMAAALLGINDQKFIRDCNNKTV
jgi:hypothetical protein